jgi:F-type H+-transporting ATPase subunit gamma
VPSLRDIRKRIRSVRSTQQITKAMKMVAAAKLRRAQDAITRARPYAALLEQALVRVARRAGADEIEAHPLLRSRPPKAAELVAITSDRGLAGAFNANIIRRGQRFLVETADKYQQVVFSTMGRKGRDFLKARKLTLRKDYSGIHGHLTFERAAEAADELAERYLAGEVDAVFLLYTEFKSAITQKVTLKQLLPIETSEVAGDAGSSVDFLYEPARDALLRDLVPRHLRIQVWRALLDSAASEHGARMTAMDAASRNAKDLIGKLTLQYNRARQATITKELMEIVSGAEALK